MDRQKPFYFKDWGDCASIRAFQARKKKVPQILGFRSFCLLLFLKPQLPEDSLTVYLKGSYRLRTFLSHRVYEARPKDQDSYLSTGRQCPGFYLGSPNTHSLILSQATPIFIILPSSLPLATISSFGGHHLFLTKEMKTLMKQLF